MARPRQTLSRQKGNDAGASIPVVESLENRQLLSAALAGAFAGGVPAALFPAQNNRVSIRVSNTSGATEAGPVTVSLYVSGTPDVGNDAVAVGTATRSVSIRAGRAANFPFRFASPSALPDGTDYLVAKIDGPTPADGSANEAIIVAPHTVTVAQPFVDLTAQITAPSAPIFVGNSGSSFGQAQVRVRNAGNVPARGVMQIALYASTNGALDSNSIPVGMTNVRAVTIRAGGSRVFPVALNIPAGTAAGSYTLFASINPGHAIAESDFSNNTAMAARPLVVTNTPPVVIDNRGHHHHDDGGGGDAGLAVFVGDGISVDDGAAPVEDTSGIDMSAPPPPPADMSGADAPPADTSAPSDSGGSPDASPPADSGSNGSDFGGGFSDLGGGADF